jgi:hypothetical protein
MDEHKRADRPFADYCFDLAEQASDQARPTHFLLVRGGVSGDCERRLLLSGRGALLAVSAAKGARRPASTVVLPAALEERL